VRRATLPAVDVAVATHRGSHDNIDRTYGALATHVAEHAIAFDGPIREAYLVGPLDSTDHDTWVTEISWPVFRPGPH
jgi:effector-binding domain-containing protein